MIARDEATVLARKVLVWLVDPASGEPLPEGLSVHVSYPRTLEVPCPPTFHKTVSVATRECICASSGAVACVAVRNALEVEEVGLPCGCYCHQGDVDE